MERWLPLALAVAKTIAPSRPPPPSSMGRGALMETLSLASFAVAAVLLLVTIGFVLTPLLGVVGALAVETALAAVIGLTAFLWGRPRVGQAPVASPEVSVGLPLAQIAVIVKQTHGLSIIAGLLVGVVAGGR